MVAPLIVGAARVVGGTTKVATGATSKAKAATVRPELLRRVRARERRKQRQQSPLSPEASDRQVRNMTKQLPGSQKLLKFSKAASGEEPLTKKIKASIAANAIFWAAIGFYIPQFIFWIMEIIGFGFESVPIIGDVLPGKELSLASWLIIVLIGTGTMLYATFVFMARGINSFGGWKGLIFILCLTGYLVIFINGMFPWFVIWIFAVVALQDEK